MLVVSAVGFRAAARFRMTPGPAAVVRVKGTVAVCVGFERGGERRGFCCVLGESAANGCEDENEEGQQWQRWRLQQQQLHSKGWNESGMERDCGNGRPCLCIYAFFAQACAVMFYLYS